jgi:Ser/Thr protein kinase RdoA (MazF antagonist)
VIDWPDASVGSPASDLARTEILLASGEPPDMDPAGRAQLTMFREVFLGAYLDSYRSRNPISDAELDSWKPLIAAARLTEGIAEEEASLLALASQLLDP